MGLNRVQLAKRNKQIIASWRKGAKVPTIARKYFITRARVYQIIK